MVSETVRMQGNEAVRKAFWAEALRLYTDAGRYAVTPEEAQLAFVNRSLVNLKLKRPEQALLDATKMNAQISPTEKAVFREIKALYGLAYFDRCLERLKYFTEQYPENTDAKLEMTRVKARLREKIDGVFSFASMYKQASQGPALIDCATFSEPVEVRESPGRGRGLFTAKAVKAGDLLLCEKAFLYEQCNFNSDACAGGRVKLLTQALQHLYHNPEYSRPFLQLNRGDYETVSQQRADGSPVVDSYLAARIISLNVKMSPRTSLGVAWKDYWKNEESARGLKDDFGSSGIWIKASYVNHSCVENCHRSFIGDMLILRATADLEPGTELMFSYRQPERFETYEDVQRSLEDWGFACDCVLCRAKLVTPGAQLNGRKLLSKKLENILDTQGLISLAEGVTILNKIEDTYTVSNSVEPVRPELLSLCISMASRYCEQGDPDKPVDLILRGLTALGYDIRAVWPTTDSAGSGAPAAQFEIKKWGIPDSAVADALVYLHIVSGAMAPSLSEHILRNTLVSGGERA
ncbi:hypothetical protein ACQRIT_000748 [Beauveria bassiana]